MRVTLFSLGALTLMSCGQISPERAADQCEARARAAQGPEVEIGIGVNSNSGGFVNGSVGVSSDFIRGTDPIALYESCVFNLTGAPPIRPPELRDL